MKRIKYLTEGVLQKYNAQTDMIDSETALASVDVPYSEANEEIAKREAYNGEYTIEDDGQPEPETKTTAEEQLDELAAAIERGLTT